MKLIKNLLFFCTICFSCTIITSCGGEAKTEQVGKEGKEYTSNYICPMHCKGSGSETAGKCPVCKMDYVKNEAKKGAHDGHNHDGHDHSGHSH